MYKIKIKTTHNVIELLVDDYFRQRNELYISNQEKEQEIKRLNNIINKIDEYVNKLRYYSDEDDDGYKISKDIHNILQELKGSDKE